jgi:hypothetical protein
VQITVREDDGVACLKLDRRVAIKGDPAATFDEDMKQGDAFGVRKQETLQLLSPGLDRPGCGKSSAEEDGSGQSNGPQDIGEDIHLVSPFSIHQRKDNRTITATRRFVTFP